MDSEFYLIVGVVVVVAAGLVFGYASSRDAFDKAVAVSEISIPPRYLVRPRPFFYGRFAFITFSLGVYMFALVFYRQLPLLIQLMPDTIQLAVPDVLKRIDGTTTVNMIAVAAAITAVFLHFLEGDFRGNFIYRFRAIVYSSMSIPFTCIRVQERLLNALNVLPARQLALAAQADLGIAVSDFLLPRKHIQRKWAELAAMHDWVEERRSLPGRYAVSPDANFAFEKAHNRFVTAGRSMLCHAAGGASPQIYISIDEFLDEMRLEYARYTACLLLTQSNSRQDFHDSCKNVGIDLGPTGEASPLAYSALYIVTLIAAIALGPYLCATVYDFSHGKSFETAIVSQQTDYVLRWLVAGIGAYFSPIFFILLIRYVAWRISVERNFTSLVTYAWILIGTFGISLLGGVIASAVNHATDPIDWDHLLLYVHRDTPWSIGPALTAVYINYYLDRQADPAKEDIIQARSTILPRMMSTIGFTFGILLLTLMIVAAQHFGDHAWTDEKARFIVVGTVGLITLSLCLVAQFGLIKRLGHAIVPPAGNALAIQG